MLSGEADNSCQEFPDKHSGGGLRGVNSRRYLGMGRDMHVLVNGVRLFFDVEGASLVPNGSGMREKPTLVLLHGGPGMDHSGYKPRFSQLADVAQVVYLDHRGNGRSEAGPRETWNLAQWGDDVRGFCEALGIERPIVLGTSFGGMVALAYATRHPAHPGRLILVSTEAAGGTHLSERIELFERLGGPEVGGLARRRFLEGEVDAAMLDAWIRLAFPVYMRVPRDLAAVRRAVLHPEVNLWFTRPGGEGRSFNLLPALGRIRCPTLVLGGEEDPMIPIVCQEEIAAALPARVARFERFPGCGHGVVNDAPERFMAVIRDFIAS
jgi:pimeloyl-ACP methyl ester carboxylesterase